MSKPDVAALQARLTRAKPVILDWPGGMHAWLATKRTEVPGRAGMSAEFGPWLRRLRNALDDPGSVEVLAEVRAWLAGSWGRGITKRSSILYAGPAANGAITLRDAGARIGISAASASRLLQEGALQGERQAMGRRTLHRVEEASVERYVVAAAAASDAAAVAARLGITPAQVDKLRSDGLLRSEAMFVRGRRSTMFTEGAVDELLGRLKAACRTASEGTDLITLDRITARRQVSLARVIAGVLRGDVPCSGAAGRTELGRFAVAAADAMARDGTGARMSVREAARTIGLSTRMMPALAAAGCIEAEGGAHLAKRGLLRASVMSFRATYATARDLGAATGTAARRLATHLAGRGINPVVPSDARAGISAVWRRSDLGTAWAE